MSKLLILEDTYLSNKVKNNATTDLVEYTFSRFKDGEMFIQYDTPVRGEDVVILCSICTPVNDNLMKVLIACDALKRASAKSITLIAPYLGYSRQDRKTKPRQPITAKLVADLLQVAGVNRVVTFDLHASQIEGFYNIPLDNIPIVKIFGAKWGKLFEDNRINGMIEDFVVVSPDHGGFVKAKDFADKAGIKNMALINKYREKANEVSSMQVIGNVENKNCIIVDDLIDTGGTLIKAATELKALGANKIFVFATHGLLSGNAITNLNACESIERIFISDSIDKREEIENTKIVYEDVSQIVLALIETFTNGGSLHDCIKGLFKEIENE